VFYSLRANYCPPKYITEYNHMLRYKIKLILKYWLGFKWINTIHKNIQFILDYNKFSNNNAERFTVNLFDLYPCLNDKTSITGFDAHYLYHPAWAIRKVKELNPRVHHDFSSILSFATSLSAFIPVKFYDYRPAKLSISGLESHHADLTKLPFKTNSVDSISCMHTIEHIGLGRYGDPIDPNGDLKAIAELKRICASKGHIIFVTPVGKPKIFYNAHRVYSFDMIIDYFKELKLIEFSLITDNNDFINKADPKLVEQQEYGCGCFLFKKL